MVSAIEAARDCTYLYLGGGSCSQVNVGRTNFKDEDVTENVVAAISEMIAFIPKKWKGIRSLHLKTADSVALPIYQSAEDRKRDREDEEAGEGDEKTEKGQEDEEGENNKKKEKKESKGKKRRKKAST